MKALDPGPMAQKAPRNRNCNFNTHLSTPMVPAQALPSHLGLSQPPPSCLPSIPTTSSHTSCGKCSQHKPYLLTKSPVRQLCLEHPHSCTMAQLTRPPCPTQGKPSQIAFLLSSDCY